MKLLHFHFLFVTIFSNLSSVKGFGTYQTTTTAKSNISQLSSSSNGNDGGKSWFAGLTNALNDGKIALVKKQAGEYDSPAIRAKLMGLIKNEPVLMLSFVK